MAQAEQFGVQRDHSDIPEQPVKVTMQAKEVRRRGPALGSRGPSSPQ